MDGAFASSVAVATAKAHASMNFGLATVDMVGRWKDSAIHALMAAEPRIIIIGGGAPVVGRNEVVVAAVGISGAKEDEDAAIAAVAASAMEAVLRT
jgi:uncharacterized protein GlcG (DUF336 family)